jgi:hypothetical protein
MQKNRSFHLFAIILVIVLVQSACALPFTITMKDGGTPNEAEEAPGEVGAGEEIPAVPTEPPAGIPKVAGPPTPTPFIYAGPLPAAGTGGVYGRLLWNGAPVQGVEIKLCDEIKFFGGCEGAEFPTTTDANGVYAILDVPPGTYGLTFKALDADTWYFVTSGILNAKDFQINAGDMVNMGDHLTVRVDVVILSPQEDERLEIARPTLSWQPYPEAAYYELTFHSDRAGSMIHRKQMTETTFVMDRDLQSCDYSFSIEVYNVSEEIIAEYDGWRRFSVRGMPTSCVMHALTPADGASAPANGIILTWEPHALAANYKIHMYNADDSSFKVLDFVTTSETSYAVTQTVPPGTYTWVVYAYDAYDESLGFTDAFTLHVTNP